MSDHDRGAYTPHNDAPLSFDARRAKGRRTFPTTLVISLVILVGMGVAIFMFYRSGVRGADQAPTPIGAPVGEIKSPAPAQAQSSQDPAQGLQIYKAEGAQSAASSPPPAAFAPPPEQPQPRPAPTTPVTAQPIAPVAAPVAKPPAAAPKPPPATVEAAMEAAAGPNNSIILKGASAKPAAPVASAPAVRKPPAAGPAVGKPVVKDEVGALLDAKPAKAEPKKPEASKAKPAKEDASTSLVRGAAVAQFGAFSSAALASSEWGKLAAAYPSEMAGKGRLVGAVEVNGGTLYRGSVSGFAARADAVAFCARLKADGRACIVK